MEKEYGLDALPIKFRRREVGCREHAPARGTARRGRGRTGPLAAPQGRAGRGRNRRRNRLPAQGEVQFLRDETVARGRGPGRPGRAGAHRGELALGAGSARAEVGGDGRGPGPGPADVPGMPDGVREGSAGVSVVQVEALLAGAPRARCQERSHQQRARLRAVRPAQPGRSGRARCGRDHPASGAARALAPSPRDRDPIPSVRTEHSRAPRARIPPRRARLKRRALCTPWSPCRRAPCPRC